MENDQKAPMVENNYSEVITDRIVIPSKMNENHYACTERDGSIVIRDLALEHTRWGDARTDIWNFADYPYERNWNWMYSEMKGWTDSPIYKCDLEKGGCHLKTDDVVVDFGANAGLFVRHAVDRGAKKVHAFEPSYDAFRCLMLNTDRDKVEVYKACVGACNDFVDIIKTTGSGVMGAFSNLDHREVVHTEKVQCYTVDYLIESGLLPTHIDFLKVDVEGAEMDIFDGISDENLSNIDRVALEYHAHPNHPEGLRERGVKLLERLEKSFGKNYKYADHWTANSEIILATVNAWR